MSETATPAPAAPSAASSAPATSGAPSTPATPSRPSSFTDSRLNWKPDAPASPAGSSAASEQPASATTGTEPAVTPAPGPIPFDRHKSILDGAYKERDTFKTQYEALRQQYDDPGFQNFRKLAGLYNQDIREFRRQVDAEFRARHPEAADELISDAARQLAARRKPAPSFEPDIPVYDERGQMVSQTFSAPKVQQLIEHAVTQALEKEVSPLKQDFQSRQQQEEIRQIQYEAGQAATSQFEEAKNWPGFLSDPAKGTVDPDVVKAFAEHQDWSLERAYIATVVPKLRAKEQAQVLDDLQTKAAASTGVNPASAATSTTRRITSFNDPALKW